MKDRGGSGASGGKQRHDARWRWQSAILTALLATVLLALTAPGAVAAGTGKITGDVTDANAKTALQGIEVCAESEEGPIAADIVSALAIPNFAETKCAVTDATGAYIIPDLEAGPWLVHFEVAFESKLNYAPQYFNGAATVADADTVSVAASSTTSGIDAAMKPGAEISGTVKAAVDKKPLEFAGVCARPQDESSFYFGGGCAQTDAEGNYTIRDLRGEAYVVEFYPPSGYAPQYYSNKPRRFEAGKVSVPAEGKVAGIDALLAPQGKITGEIVDAKTGTPLHEAQVCVWQFTNEEQGCANTDAEGKYMLTGLPAGKYTVRVNGPLGGNYTERFYADSTDEGEALQTTVVAGATDTGVDVALPPGGTITGRVISSVTKAGLKEVRVCADPPVEGFGGCTETDANGEYAITGLTESSYAVDFYTYNSDYAEQFYGGGLSFSEAPLVPVAAGATVTHIDATLQLGGSIAGTVSAAGGGALAEIEVCADLVSTELSQCARTDIAGAYTLHGLPTGNYTVNFGTFETGQNYVQQFYAGKSNEAEADPVSVTAKQQTPGIDASMSVGGKISGRVTDASTKAPLSFVEVCAQRGGRSVACGGTDRHGEYTIVGLASGDYNIVFRPFGRYAGKYYTGVSGEQPVPVSAVAGSTTDGINAALTSTYVPVLVFYDPPEVIGRVQPGQTFSERHARWENGVNSYAYRWYRCDAQGAGCELVIGDTSRTYTATASDVGHTFKVSETASNLAGTSAPALSPPSHVVTSGPPGPPAPPAGGGGGGGGTGSTTTTTTATHGVASGGASLPGHAQVLNALLAALNPLGKNARLASLRNRGAFTMTFTSPSAGSLTMAWYLVPKGAHVSAAKPVLIAIGQASFSSGGKGHVTVKLNARGRRLLAHLRKLKLTAKGTFTPRGGSPVSATRTFALH